MRRAFKVAGLAVLGAVLLLLLENGVARSDWLVVLHKFGEHLAMALLVAAVLVISVEYLNHVRHTQLTLDIGRNVLNAMLSRDLPERIYNELKDTIFASPFYRREYRIVYTMTSAPSATGAVDAELVALEGTQSYEVYNMTDQVAHYDVRVQIGTNKKRVDLCKIVDIRVDGAYLDAEKIRQANAKPIKGFIVFSERVQIPAKKAIRIITRYQQCCSEHSFESFCSILPTTDMRLTVLTPAGGVDVEVETMHPKDASPTGAHNGDTLHEWELPCASLPGQGMQFKWSRRAADSAGSA